jgi:hypothetical protein
MANRDMSWAPSDKVKAGSLGGASTLVVLWLLATYAHVEMPPVVEGALGVLVTAGLAYFVPNRAPKED